MFTDMHEKLEVMVNYALNSGMKIVLVRDHNMPQKLMDQIECQTPIGLKISIFVNKIVSLYDTDDYQKTILRHILLNVDA